MHEALLALSNDAIIKQVDGTSNPINSNVYRQLITRQQANFLLDNVCKCINLSQIQLTVLLLLLLISFFMLFLDYVLPFCFLITSL